VNYLVGDLQGCAEALDRLLAEIAFSPSRDHVYVLGDLVNRGPASLATLRRLRGLAGSASCVLGNHDWHLLAVAAGVRPRHRSDTLDDILDAPDREIEDRPEQADEDDQQAPHQLAVAADLALGPEEIAQGDDDEHDLHDDHGEQEQQHLRVAHPDAHLQSIRADDGASVQSASIRGWPARPGPTGSHARRPRASSFVDPRTGIRPFSASSTGRTVAMPSDHLSRSDATAIRG